MRRGPIVFAVVVSMFVSAAWAEENRKTSERVIGGVISGLLGEPAQTSDAAYTAQERDRLVSFLQGGEYVTSRQGESIDMMVFGVPLTHRDHVYTAKPIPPSATFSRQRAQ